jgi:hypothetical protein
MVKTKSGLKSGLSPLFIVSGRSLVAARYGSR